MMKTLNKRARAEIRLDGSKGEGGGQILRSASAFPQSLGIPSGSNRFARAGSVRVS